MEKRESAVSETEKKSVISKVMLYLIPFMLALYVSAFLTRINIGFAALEMNVRLGFTHRVFGIGSGIFFVGYFFLQLPGNLILEKTGARIVVAPIIFLCGILSFCMIYVKKPADLYLLRFILGAVQAGFFPGMVLYMTYWFPAEYRARAMAIFLTASPVSGIICGILSSHLLNLNGVMNLEGWQWIFAVEALPAMLLGIAAFFYLPDSPSQATWLNKDQKAVLLSEMEKSNNSGDGMKGKSLSDALKNKKVWLLSAFHLSMLAALYGITFWLPIVMKDLFGMSDTDTELFSAVPFILSAVFMILIAMVSDKNQKRENTVFIMMLSAVFSIFIAVFIKAPLFQMIFITTGLVCVYSAQAPFWSIPPNFLKQTAVAAGIAIINSIGNLGGFLGPYLVGHAKAIEIRGIADFWPILLLLIIGLCFSVIINKNNEEVKSMCKIDY